MRLFVPALTVVALLAACGGEESAPAAKAPEVAAPAPAAPAPPPAEPATPKGAFQCCAAERDTQVVRDYLAAQDALAKDDDAKAATALGALATSAGLAKVGSEPPAQPGAAERQEGRSVALQGLQDAASAAQKAPDIAARRTAFKAVSTAITPFARGSGGGALTITEAFCPMADASWLQEGNTIANPYYGSSMLTCGSFK